MNYGYLVFWQILPFQIDFFFKCTPELRPYDVCITYLHSESGSSSIKSSARSPYSTTIVSSGDGFSLPNSPYSSGSFSNWEYVTLAIFESSVMRLSLLKWNFDWHRKNVLLDITIKQLNTVTQRLSFMLEHDQSLILARCLIMTQLDATWRIYCTQTITKNEFLLKILPCNTYILLYLSEPAFTEKIKTCKNMQKNMQK